MASPNKSAVFRKLTSQILILHVKIQPEVLTPKPFNNKISPRQKFFIHSNNYFRDELTLKYFVLSGYSSSTAKVQLSIKSELSDTSLKKLQGKRSQVE